MRQYITESPYEQEEKPTDLQFTATCYILKGEQSLLVYHKKLRKWLPPGGHLEKGEIPPDAAIREVKEETGLTIELIPQENILIDRWNAKSTPRPYMCLLENIPATSFEPAHQHIDFIYLGTPTHGALIEDDDVRWFTVRQIEKLEDDVDIFVETKETIAHLLQRVLL